MSWDVVVFSSKQAIESVEAIDPDQLFPVDFDAVMAAHFPGLVKDGEYRQVEQRDWALDYYGDDTPCSNLIVSLYGEEAMVQLAALAREQGWQIFDTALGAMIDLDDPRKNGYEHFRNYVDSLLKDESPPDDQ